MGKADRSIQIPAEVAEMLAAMAKQQGISDVELMVRILKGVLGNPLLRRYVKNGAFDAAQYDEDRRRDRQKLNAWHRSHPEEIANLRRAAAATRKRVSRLRW